MRRWWLSPWLWVGVYLAVLIGIGVGMVRLRQQVLATDYDQQVAQWQKWRDEAARQDGRSGPVQREVPRTEEPPMYLLMRDHFPVIFAGSILFPAVILGFFMGVAYGVLQQASEPKAVDAESSEST
jgi:hypothetical protein